MESNPFSYAHLANVAFIEDLYEKFKSSPESVDVSWRQFFEGMQFALGGPILGTPKAQGSESVVELIDAYRRYGHLEATFNPIATKPAPKITELDPKLYGLHDPDQKVPSYNFFKETQVPLKVLIETLRKTYCHKIGFEYEGFVTPECEKWIQEKIEPLVEIPLSNEEKIRIFKDLNRSEILESFIHIKYPGQKRFSLEGGETLIPILAEIFHQGAEEGIQESFIGMPHRGRLNVLANIVGKSYSMIFHEFEDHYLPTTVEGSGDVKYHKGFSGDFTTSSGKKIHVSIPSNPSHLESVDPVLEGGAKARQEQKGKDSSKSILPILVHGDAALSGQGVVYETMQFYNIDGFSTGGTIHIVINNQIGFTATPQESRSTTYCTDIAKAFNAPVFHVDAEDPESCIYVARLALNLRQKFGCDIFIDLNCYRKYGHNETDEPAFTQPLEYKLIRDRPPIRNIYLEKLIEKNVIQREEAQSFEKSFHDSLTKALEDAKRFIKESEQISKIKPKSEVDSLEVFKPENTAVEKQKLISLGNAICMVPSSFHLHSKLRRSLEGRKALLEQEDKLEIDWGFAESLSFASLLSEGIHIRLSGQDSKRGTFSHRHCVLYDQETGEPFIPLRQIKEAVFDVYNSTLSEYAVMGFEYGYSLTYSKALVLWEAQFGDFNNGGQIVIDQYIASAEKKWNRSSSFVLLLPHGYEGMGPEHSSARIERFLQLAAEQNMILVIPTTASQYFHILRRQGLRKYKKPMVIFTPKAILRFGPSLCSLKQLAEGQFHEILDDPKAAKKTKRLILCAGKVYYDLSSERETRKAEGITILRIEQLYPLHTEKLKKLLEKYKGFKECLWVQEEHKNMGAWNYLRPILKEMLPEKVDLYYVGREKSASPATASHSLSDMEKEKFLEQAFNEENDESRD